MLTVTCRVGACGITILKFASCWDKTTKYIDQGLIQEVAQVHRWVLIQAVDPN